MTNIELLNVGLALVEAYNTYDVQAIDEVWADVPSDSQEPDTAPHLRSQAHTTPSHKSRAAIREDIREQHRWWKARKQLLAQAEAEFNQISAANRDAQPINK